jgi:hypothetical protein
MNSEGIKLWRRSFFPRATEFAQDLMRFTTASVSQRMRDSSGLHHS